MKTITEKPLPSKYALQRLNVGVISPYPLVSALTGKKFDWTKPESTKILPDVLETNYAELFDVEFNSPLYPIKASNIKISKPADGITAPLNTIKKLGDLKSIGVENLESLKVWEASIHPRLPS